MLNLFDVGKKIAKLPPGLLLLLAVALLVFALAYALV
jgi:hypothetical protein